MLVLRVSSWSQNTHFHSKTYILQSRMLLLYDVTSDLVFFQPSFVSKACVTSNPLKNKGDMLQKLTLAYTKWELQTLASPSLLLFRAVHWDFMHSVLLCGTKERVHIFSISLVYILPSVLHQIRIPMITKKKKSTNTNWFWIIKTTVECHDCHGVMGNITVWWEQFQDGAGETQRR